MSLDAAAARTLNKLVHRNTLIDYVVTTLASGLAYVLCVSILFISYTYPSFRTLEFFFSLLIPALVSRFVITSAIYSKFKRHRPSEEDGIRPLFHNRNPSFPSGHASFFFALSTTLCIIGVPGAALFALATFIMCTARVIAGAHFPSDILGGGIIGVGTTVLYFVITGI